MSQSLLDTPCLKINASWQVIGETSVRQAFSDAAAGAATLLRFEEGFPIPITLEDWMKIEVENGDDFILTGIKYHGTRKIRVPRVAIYVNFNKLIAKEQRLNLKTLARRYGYKCAVSDKPLTEEEYSREHVRPRSHGGKSGWENEVLMDRKLNSKRGNKSYTKMGLREPKVLGAPPPVFPIHSIVNRNHYPEWRLFKVQEY